MGFANRGYKALPKTYDACDRMWQQASARARAKGFLVLANNTTLHKGNGCYTARHQSTDIVTFYPKVKVVNAGRWSESPTTQDRITRLTGARMSSDRSLGVHENIRINGWPFFNGIRIDNFGCVLPEDQRPDKKTVVVKEVSLRYTALWRRIHKALAARWEVGEFSHRDFNGQWSLNKCQGALLEIERMFGAGEAYAPYELAMDLMFGGPNTIASGGLQDVLKHRRAHLRDWWLNCNNGYETIEVK